MQTQLGLGALTQGSRDAGLLETLPAGVYTIHLGSKLGETGVAMAEVYEIDPSSSSRFPAIAVLAKTSTGDRTMIGGFIVRGEGVCRVIVRGLGPSLVDAFGSGCLTDPKIDLYSGATHLKSNDDWDNTPELLAAFASVGMKPLPAGSKDAAMVAYLPPGIYTVNLSGVNNATGIAMIEIYVSP